MAPAPNASDTRSPVPRAPLGSHREHYTRGGTEFAHVATASQQAANTDCEDS